MSGTQYPLFSDQLGPWQQHSDASRAAALDNFPRSGTQRARVLCAIAAADDGLTDHEIVELCAISPSSERPRRVELVDAALVVDSGARRRTPLGSEATVWMVTDIGRAAAHYLRAQS